MLVDFLFTILYEVGRLGCERKSHRFEYESQEDLPIFIENCLKYLIMD
jgi:hypothetical protein